MDESGDARRVEVVANSERQDLRDLLLSAKGPMTLSEIRAACSVRDLAHQLRELESVGLASHDDAGRWTGHRVSTHYRAAVPEDAPLSERMADMYLVGRRVRRTERWETECARVDSEWRDWVEPSLGADTTLRLTRAELDELGRLLLATVQDYRTRTGADERPPSGDTEVVFVTLSAFPLRASLDR